ncbi:MAG: tetratricopeptide repeat protein [Nitrospinota bacterium]|nr:tetratricopeptide repeat protein [Nitrospinota bacterium]
MDSGQSEIQSLFSRGEEYHRFGLFDEAVEIFSEVIHMDPQASHAHNAMGKVLSDLGRWKEALESFNAAIVINPAYADALFNRGGENLDLGRYMEAMADFSEAARHDPSMAKAQYNCGLANLALGYFVEAQESFSAAIKIDSTLPQAFLNMGMARLGLNNPHQALEDFDEAVRLAPYDIGAYHNRACAFLALGRMEEAIEDYTTFIQRAGPLLQSFVQDDLKLIQDIKNGALPKDALDPPKPITTPKIEQTHREATLFVDICGSTKLVNTYGGFHFHSLLSVLERIFDGHATPGGCVYRKGLGDGFMAIFSGCQGAITACVRTLEELTRHNNHARESHQLQVRIGVDFGETAVSRNEDRFGIPVNVAKRIEGVMAGDFLDLKIPTDKFPVENRIFISYTVYKSLETLPAFIMSKIGVAALRGLDRIRHEIYLVDWRKTVEQMKQ